MMKQIHLVRRFASRVVTPSSSCSRVRFYTAGIPSPSFTTTRTNEDDRKLAYMYAKNRSFDTFLHHLSVILTLNGTDDSTRHFAKTAITFVLNMNGIGMDDRMALYELSKKHQLLCENELLGNVKLIQQFLGQTSTQRFHHNFNEYTMWVDKVIKAIEPLLDVNGGKLSSTKLFYTIIVHYVKHKEFRKGQYLYKKMTELNGRFAHARDYSFLMCNVLQNNEFKWFEQLKSDCERLKIEFRRSDLQHLLTSYLRVNFIHEAMVLFDQLTVNDNTRLNSLVYTVLFDTIRKYIHQHAARKQDSDGQLQVYKKYIQSIDNHLRNGMGIPSDAIFRFYASAIYALAQIGNVESVNYWFTTMKQQGLLTTTKQQQQLSSKNNNKNNNNTKNNKPIEQILNAVINAFVTNNQLSESIQFIASMKSLYGIGPSEKSFIPLLTYCSENGMVERGIEMIHKEMIVDHHLKPTALSFNCLLNGCKTEKEFELVTREMERNQVPFDVSTFNIEIKRLCSQQLLNQALLTYERMKLLMRPDAITIATLVLAFKDDQEIINGLYSDCRRLEVRRSRFLNILFLQFSPMFREWLIQSLLKPQELQELQELQESEKVIHQAHFEYPELLSSLLFVMRESKDERTAQMTQLIRNHIHREIEPIDPSSIRIFTH